jgi:ABC-type Zn uptake system ZnuABC Zn-binding protein ZnuA
MKHTFLALLISVLPICAKDDVPRGFVPISELKTAQAEAIAEKKLVVLVVKGMDDSCPNCADTLKNGLRAAGPGVIKVFARAETIGKADATAFPPALQARVKNNFTTGAEVTFVVFDPEMSKIIVEACRRELQSDKKAIAAFKKTVQDATKALK